MLDQVFVLLKQWLLGYSPAVIRPGVSILLTIIPILLVFPVLFALTTVLERKGLGRIQNRYGPNRVGFYGILQPMADAVKSLTKEDIVPASADHTVHFLAPLVLLAVAFLPYAVLPIGRNMIAANLDAGVLVLLRHWSHFRAVRLYGGVVKPQQVFPARRHAGRGPDDQL